MRGGQRVVIRERLVLHFPRELVERPIVYRLSRDYGLEFNILKASVTPDEEGLMVLEVRGQRRGLELAMEYLAASGVRVQPLSRSVVLNEQRCTHCGACVALCPSRAFRVEPGTHYIRFEADKCLACGFCIKACPARAMEIRV